MRYTPNGDCSLRAHLGLARNEGIVRTPVVGQLILDIRPGGSDRTRPTDYPTSGRVNAPLSVIMRNWGCLPRHPQDAGYSYRPLICYLEGACIHPRIGVQLDTLTRSQRSERMSRVRAKDTKPEMRVRRLVHSLGYRYRLHRSDLPGKPDLVFVARQKVIFVHGCFWHRHAGCPNTRLPKSNLSFWQPKLETNKARDTRNKRRLTVLGWRYLVIWECETHNASALTRKVIKFLESQG